MSKAEYIKIINSLKEKTAEPGWDGKRAKPVSPELIDEAGLIAQQMIPYPEITSNSKGNVILRYDKGNNRLEYEFYADGNISQYQIKNGTRFFKFVEIDSIIDMYGSLFDQL